MKAARYSEYGGPEVIKTVEIDKPTIKDNQILVEVHAAGLNPFDWKLRAGYMKNMIPLNLPVTIGADFSGLVTGVGDGSDDFEVGDAVYGSAIVLGGGSGAVAQFAAANVGSVALKPEKADFSEAAAVVLVGVSAIQALDNHAELKAGQKILIHGGAGGIGSTAIQYAKHLGAYVITTVRGADTEFVRGLGADEVIDYETQAFEDAVQDVDVVFDTTGGDAYKKSFSVLRDGGVLVSMTEQKHDEELAKKHNVKAVTQNSQTDAVTLAKLAKLVDAGAIKPAVDREFTLDEADKAFEHLESGHPQGKVVVKVK